MEEERKKVRWAHGQKEALKDQLWLSHFINDHLEK